MPLNEKAALGGAANLETCSQGSLVNPPINPAQHFRKSYPRKARRAAPRPCMGLAIAGLSIPSRAGSATPRHGRSYPPLERALDRLWRAMQARSRR